MSIAVASYKGKVQVQIEVDSKESGDPVSLKNVSTLVFSLEL